MLPQLDVCDFVRRDQPVMAGFLLFIRLIMFYQYENKFINKFITHGGSSHEGFEE